MIELAYKALDVLLGLFGGLRRVRVLVHLATRVPQGDVAYFIKVINLSASRDVEVTHVWIADESPIHIFNEARPLPVRLRPDETWETWVPFNVVPENLYSRVHGLVRVQLSNGSVLKSRLNTKVPPVGHVAGPVQGGGSEKLALPVAEAPKRPLIEAQSTPNVAPATTAATISADELAVLKMFVEFKDQHTVDDVAKRFSLTRQKAEYLLDVLTDKRYLGKSDKYRNAKPILFITRGGRDLLVEMGEL